MVEFLAEPVAVPIREDGCLDVVTSFITGAGFQARVAFSTAEAQLYSPSSWLAVDAECEVLVGRTSTLEEPLA